MSSSVFKISKVAGTWRWELVSFNGNTLAKSGKSYTRKSDARRAVNSVVSSASTAVVVVDN